MRDWRSVNCRCKQSSCQQTAGTEHSNLNDASGTSAPIRQDEPAGSRSPMSVGELADYQRYALSPLGQQPGPPLCQADARHLIPR